MHPELDKCIASGVKAGLKMVIGTNGLLLSEDKIIEYKKMGLSGLGVNFHSVNPEQHDRYMGTFNAYEKMTKAIKLCIKHDLHVQIHNTVTRSNYKQIRDIANFSKEIGASIVNFFFLVCVGRGESSMDLSPDLYEESLTTIAQLQTEMKGIMVQSRCTPHFKRILYERNPDSPYTRATGYNGGGCPAASHYCRIDPKGEVTPCPYMNLSAGNIRETTFWDIWDNAILFKSMRNKDLLLGRCSECEYKLLCGGCRARSLTQSGNLMAEDPNCNYIPQGGKEIPVMDIHLTDQVTWTPEAKERLKKIPIFLRGLIKKKLEERAVAEGVPVTKDLMQRHKIEREKELGIKLG